ncbi:MAG: hypothetical protein IJS01_04300 [Lentisphaeria bacterium]|nr:hypothetical protein [Lentisphaeria bacterium]
MKKLLTIALAAGFVLGCSAAEKIFKGNSKNDKDMLCCYMGGKFFADAARKQQIYHHPGNMVSKEAKATLKNCIYRLTGDRIYKGSSTKKEDCIATILETKTRKGDALAAKIFEGFVVVRDVQKTYDKKTKTDTVTGYKVTADGVNEIQPKVLFTIDNNKIFRGDSTDGKDCLLTYTGKFTAGRLLFMAIELAK